MAEHRMMRHFDYRHLPPDLQEISMMVGELAYRMIHELPECAETTTGLRKLLEAKDCFVRAKTEAL
jgi:hypothetical protein